jgi:hypothetical protein
MSPTLAVGTQIEFEGPGVAGLAVQPQERGRDGVGCRKWIGRSCGAFCVIETFVSRGRQPSLYLQFLLLVFAGWVNRHQQAVIEYLQAENQSLREQLGKNRIRWSDTQRRRLAEQAKAIGRSALAALGPVVTPDTLLRWYRGSALEGARY